VKARERAIEVWGDWAELRGVTRVGTLHATPVRGKEIFAFEYDSAWVAHPQRANLDPNLALHQSRQYGPEDQTGFRVFLDSAPDRWGRLLMNRREAQAARVAGRAPRTLLESDYLLGVYDGHRLGGLRFRLEPNGPFLDNNSELASPPWTSLRALEHASLQLERPDAESKRDYAKWLQMLIAPGGSLGGARPKASVLDEQGRLWIAKFPSAHDTRDVGAWEHVLHLLAQRAGVEVPEALARNFVGRHHTFLTRRFDRNDTGQRRHFASAMTLLQRSDGDDASTGVSYLEFVELLARAGAQPERDMQQLWRRIVFYMCVSNVDDHLRNHGFLLHANGWALAPAYDMNPAETGDGLKLNVSEADNSQSLDLARSVAQLFRVKVAHARQIVEHVTDAVKQWREVASSVGIPKAEQQRMRNAFRVAELAKFETGFLK
jgi:serine/threonine-protein kinase HipA